MYLTVEKAAQRLQTNIWAVYYGIYFGHLEAVNLGGDCWRIREVSVDAYDQRRRGRAPAGITGDHGDSYAGPLFGLRLQDDLEVDPMRKSTSQKTARPVDHSPRRRNHVDDGQLELIV